MSFITKIFSTGLQEVVSGVSNIADKFITTPDEKKAFELEITKLSQEKELKILEEANNELDSLLKNTEDARNREIQIATSDKAPLLNKIITPILALIVVIGGGYLFYVSKSPDERTALIGVIMLVLGYFFGSSIGSKNSNEAIRRIAESK